MTQILVTICVGIKLTNWPVLFHSQK